MADVVVLGSANADLVLEMARAPVPGETVLADVAHRLPGGKGANQAVAAARAGAATAFLGAVGTDEDAAMVCGALVCAGVDCGLVRTAAAPTGVAVVMVGSDGQNSIVVAPGANATITNLTGSEQAAVAGARVLLCQLEIPVDAVLAAVGLGPTLVLNAAPAQPLPDALWAAVDVLVVNEHEAVTLTGAADVESALAALRARVGQVVITLGAAGVFYAAGGVAPQRVSAPTVEAIDTTGAGDAFCGVLAAGLAAGQDLDAAVRRAVVAGSLAVRRRGAIASMPTAAEIDAAV